MLINNKFQAQTLTGNRINPTGNSRCYALASRALNMSCRFGQSARSIESRRVVKLRLNHPVENSLKVNLKDNDVSPEAGKRQPARK